ncbi:MAG: nitroreductase family protein [Candidatus Methanomethylophilaceae archaeon]
MEILQEILTRRSIRKYQEKKVSGDVIKKLLHAAMQAPSANNEQPWEFIVVNNKGTLLKISEILPNAGMVKDAAVAIVICGDLEKEVAKGRWVQDCSAATENLLLEVVHQGLGAVWTSVHPNKGKEEALRKLFNLPNNVIPLSIIPVGYPAEEKEYENRFKEERVHYEKW